MSEKCGASSLEIFLTDVAIGLNIIPRHGYAMKRIMVKPPVSASDQSTPREDYKPFPEVRPPKESKPNNFIDKPL